MTETVRVTHVGSVLVEVDGEIGKMITHICGVLYIPGGTVNLLSTQKLVAKGIFPLYHLRYKKVIFSRA